MLRFFLLHSILIPSILPLSGSSEMNASPLFSSLKPSWDCLIGKKMNSIHMVPVISQRKRTDFQYVMVPDNVRITSGQWLFEVTGSAAFVCGFVDGFYPLDSTLSLGYPSRHKWVWSTESFSGVATDWFPSSDILEDDETTVHCRLDCDKKEIAFRVNDHSEWVVVASSLVNTTCFIPVVASRQEEDFVFSLRSLSDPAEPSVLPITLVDLQKIRQDSPENASPEPNRLGVLARTILYSLIEQWPLELSLFSCLPLVISTEQSSVLTEVFSLLKEHPLLVTPFLKQLWGMRKLNLSLWLLYRDLLLLELLKEFSMHSEGSIEWAEQCVESLSSEWCTFCCFP